MLGLSQRMASITATISIKAERTPCDTEVRKNSHDSSEIQAGGAENGSQTYNFNEWLNDPYICHMYRNTREMVKSLSKHMQHKYNTTWASSLVHGDNAAIAVETSVIC